MSNANKSSAAVAADLSQQQLVPATITSCNSMPASEGKSELMESAHLLCSLFTSKPSSSSSSPSPSSSSPATLSKTSSKGPLKKRCQARAETNQHVTQGNDVTNNNEDEHSGYATLLYTEGRDEDYLSPQLCLTRAQIEAFAATPADIASRRTAGGRSISRSLTAGQVGLRCIHCKHLPLKMRAMSAVHYPGSIRLVYQAVRNFQRNHFLNCKAIPESIKEEFRCTRTRFVQSKGRSHLYWAKSCADKGLVDTDEAIRFCFDKKKLSNTSAAAADATALDLSKKPTKKRSRKSDKIAATSMNPAKKAKKAAVAAGADAVASTSGLPQATELKPPALAKQVTLDRDQLAATTYVHASLPNMPQAAEQVDLMTQQASLKQQSMQPSSLAASLSLPVLVAKYLLQQKALGLPSAFDAPSAAASVQQVQDEQAEAQSTCRSEYLLYLQNLDRMSNAIAAAQHLEVVFRANPTTENHVQFLAANKQMTEIMQHCKLQALTLQRLRLESKLQDMNVSTSATLGLPSPPVRKVSMS